MNTNQEPIVGQGNYRYKVIDNWAKLPSGWNLREVPGIAVDKKDNIYLFSRSEHPLVILDREGNFLRSWGEGVFKNPHGIYIAPDDAIFLTDDGDHTVRKFTLEGELLLTIGTPGAAAPFMSNKPFNRPCQIALSPKGDIYIADGYGNGSVHVFSPDGKFIKSWGRAGSDTGEFNVVHNICCDADGFVYVADRENHRIQVFDGNGKFQEEWHNLHRPCGLYMEGSKKPVFYVGELCPQIRTNHDYPNLGPRVSIIDHRGKLLSRLGNSFGLGLTEFTGPHGLATDSKGDLYVGEVAIAQWNFFCAGKPMPENLRCLRKLVKV
jgi:DNA-binding beta-propeller fold protein YncE